ncbi:uncharacterized protein LOC143600139 [Bidens hawaiensis]|uniref:uncharacterized protein LOC143600139 n=1 Tax=Bidens hawaiensis TaxID=980011 RepID=UPI004049B417
MVDSWVMDFGSSFHAMHSGETMVNLKVGNFGKVRIANGDVLNVTSMGDVNLVTLLGTVWNLKNVKVIPLLKRMLISVSQLDELGMEVKFRGGKWKVTKGSLVIACGNRKLLLKEENGSGSRVISGSGGSCVLGEIEDGSVSADELGLSGVSTGPSVKDEYYSVISLPLFDQLATDGVFSGEEFNDDLIHERRCSPAKTGLVVMKMIGGDGGSGWKGTKIRTLDGTKVSYSSWTKLFKLHAKAYKVLDHIEDKIPPKELSEEFSEWSKLDSLVLQWIYSTLSDTLLVRVLANNITARDAWLKLEGIFLNNKRARVAALEQKFSNLLLTACTSMEDYCQKLKDIADQLGDVDHLVSEERLVLQLVRGLPSEYEVVAAIINQSTPTWDEALTQINLEQQRKAAQQNSQSAFMANGGDRTQQNWSSQNYNNQRNGFNSNNNQGGRGYGQYRGCGRNQRGRGRTNPQTHGLYGSTSTNWNNSGWPYPGWTPPPSPFPTQPAGPAQQQWGQTTNQMWTGSHCPWTQATHPTNIGPNTQRTNAGTVHSMANTAGQFFQPSAPPQGQTNNTSLEFACFTDSNATELANAMGQVNLNAMGSNNFNPMDPAWYMDSGASSHLTSDPGMISSHVSNSNVNSIFVGNGNHVPVFGSGNTLYTTQNQTYKLNNILYTPSIIKNLLSVRKFNIDNWTSTEFDPFGFTVKDYKTGVTLSRHDSTGELYPFTAPVFPSAFVTTTANQWHNRLGHPGDPILPLLRSSLSISSRSDPNWRATMIDEFKALQVNNTWELVPPPTDHPVIRCLWLFRHKFNSDGTLEWYKARLVVNGKSQMVGIDCEDTFSPVVKPATIRTVLSLAVSRSWPIHQLDVKNVFLHGDLQETVFMHQPPGFVDRTYLNHVCRLKKSLYGLKQAPRALYTRFSTFIIAHGFGRSTCDQSLFIYNHGRHQAYLLFYVDDIVLTASTDDLLKTIINLLSREFAITDLGHLHHFLGIFIRDIIERAGLTNCKPCVTPVDTTSKLSANTGNLLPNDTLYRELAGALQYLTFTRPDITYAVQQVCLFMHAPRDSHFGFMKRIIRYLSSSIDHGLRIVPSSSATLTAYSDADWGGCLDSRRSTSGYCVFLGDNLLSWSSKRQATISRSSVEAEYRGVANAVAETTWLRNLLIELHVPLTRATIVYCDNVSAVYLSHNPVQHQRTKHVEIDIHFVREKVRLGHVRVLHVPSSSQYVDIFTKGLPRQLFHEFRDSLNVQLRHAQAKGGY